MKISTKGRYALRVMIDIAEHMDDSGSYVSLKDVSIRQNVSLKYLEMIVGILSRGNFLTSCRGKSGGYRLTRKPEEYTIGSILKETEGSLAPVSCLESGHVNCDRAQSCVTLPIWVELDKIIDDYLESKTLADLLPAEQKE